MEYAVVADGVVVNVIIATKDFAQPIGAVPLEPGFGIGDFFDGSTWTRKPQEEMPEPEQIDPLTVPLDRLDFWLVAASAGISKWSVRDRIAAMPEGVEKNEAIAWFEDSPRYRRDDPLVISLAAAEGITPEQLDTLWIWAVGG